MSKLTSGMLSGMRRYPEQAVFCICVLSVLMVAVVCLRDFLSQQLFNLSLGLLAIPFVIRTHPGGKGSCRFAAAALLLMGLTFHAPVNTLVYFALTATLLFLVESRFGRINLLTVVVAILTTPLSAYLVNTFSFPIRLRLTSICGHIFRTAGLPIEVAGNTFTLEGGDFTVDPACMGLNMLITSFIIGIILFGYYIKKYDREVSVWMTLAYLGIVLLLNVFSNLARMMVLVFFRVFPDTVMHDAIGIVCLLVQVVVPLWIVCCLLIKPAASVATENQSGRETGLQLRIPAPPTGKQQNVLKTGLIQLACCALLWIVAFRVIERKRDDTTPVSVMNVPGYAVTPHSGGIVKLENNASLVYIKQIRWFCDTEHNPMTCWNGSGYRMLQVRETMWGELTVYTGILQRDGDTLHTAWWYGNGISATNSQFRWRWDMLAGAAAYSLVNVTTGSRESLVEEAIKIDSLLRPLRMAVTVCQR